MCVCLLLFLPFFLLLLLLRPVDRLFICSPPAYFHSSGLLSILECSYHQICSQIQPYRLLRRRRISQLFFVDISPDTAILDTSINSPAPTDSNLCVPRSLSTGNEDGRLQVFPFISFLPAQNFYSLSFFFPDFFSSEKKKP